MFYTLYRRSEIKTIPKAVTHSPPKGIKNGNKHHRYEKSGSLQPPLTCEQKQ